MQRNNRYLELTTRLLEKITVYGADIFHMPPAFFRTGYATMQGVIFNLIRNRDIMEGLTFEQELWEKHNRYKWNLIEPVLRPYYAKDNPYYGVEVPEERKLFFQKLEQLKNGEEQKET